MPKRIDVIAGEIMTEMEKLLLERVYVAIIKEGKVIYSSTALDKHIELLKLFAITEFKQLPSLGHSFPLPGTNLAIFKVSDDYLVALYTKKGYQGQLLSFKTKINQYKTDLQQASELSTPNLVETEAKGQILPKLTQTVSLTMGMSEDESAVLKLCDGNHSIREILIKTRIPRKNVVDIIRRYEQKEWLKLDFQGEIDVTPISIKKFPETAVRLGMISKKSYDINELCNGTNTIQDIADKLLISERELKKILKKMEKNKITKMTVKIPEEEPSVTETPAVVAEKIEETISNPELYIKPILTASVSFSMGFDQNEKRILELLDGSHTIIDLYHVTRVGIVDIFNTIFKYEEKGWIRIPIEDFMKIVAIKEKLKSEFDTAVLEANYNQLMEKQVAPAAPSLELAEQVLAETAALADEEREIMADLHQRIQNELPLMPELARTKLVEKLVKLSAHSREGMLGKLLTSESSRKFRKPAAPPVQVPAVPAPPAPPVQTRPPPPIQAPPPPVQPSLPLNSPTDLYTPVIDETPLIQPSQLLDQGASEEPLVKPLPDNLLSPRIPVTPPPDVPSQPTQPIPPPPPIAPTTPTISPQASVGETAAEGDQLTEVLSFIDSLLGIPEILYLALIDYGGSVFYQTTKETSMWDISRDTLKFIQNWNSQAPSVFLGGDIKYAVIKTEPDMLIATNVKGFGHIVAIPINDKLFILTKVSKEGDALLIAEDVAIVAKQIKEMFPSA